MTITETLIAEHRLYRTFFDFIEGALPGLRTVSEAKLLGVAIEALLAGHAAAEEDLVFVTLRHALAEKGPLAPIYHEHHELDGSLRRIRTARTLAEARRRLLRAISASRKHFDYEERSVFPLVERTLAGQTLTQLNEASLRQVGPEITPTAPGAVRTRGPGAAPVVGPPSRDDRARRLQNADPA